MFVAVLLIAFNIKFPMHVKLVERLGNEVNFENKVQTTLCHMSDSIQITSVSWKWSVRVVFGGNSVCWGESEV